MRIITRFEDMSQDGYLRVTQDDDGDVFVEVCGGDDGDFPQDIEFCNSGSRSPRTHRALLALVEAMFEDERERPS